MVWNWQQPEWPEFIYDPKALEPFERAFLFGAGELVGAFRHVGADDQDVLRIELIEEEAVKTSAIEGEILDRASVQSSLRRQFGLDADTRRAGRAEQGIAEMLVDLYRSFAAPLTHQTLFSWHAMLLDGQRGLDVIGGYRTHAAAMQVVSGPDYAPTIHFEAPPSNQMVAEMERFIAWFYASLPTEAQPLPALTRAGLVHLYFVSIHPFEDGNGRIGRALSEKALAQSLGQPSLIALSHVIERRRKDYYAALERNNRYLDVTDWLVWFAETAIEAQRTTIRRIEFYLAKAVFYQRFRGQLNERQEKVVARMFREGIDGFKGGLSAENYIRITGTSRATATRDLSDLVGKGVFTRRGELRHTRYAIALPSV
jgi:Fic family protein